ncbi:MAG: CBS domain-containing protein [Thaumarchaeota archaeon]|nr:CBS domain-containing protein [Nitrososphaerota archaeon]
MPAQTVSDIMTPKVVTIDLDATAKECAKMMAKRGVSSAVIIQNDAPIGIVTERDLVSKVLADAVDPNKVLVRDIMSTPLITIAPTATIVQAAELMAEYRVRRLVVIDPSGALAGIATTGDIARTLAEKQNFREPTFNAMARYKEGIEGGGPYQ